MVPFAIVAVGFDARQHVLAAATASKAASGLIIVGRLLGTRCDYVDTAQAPMV